MSKILHWVKNLVLVIILLSIFIVLSQVFLIGRTRIVGSTMKDYKDGNYYLFCRICKSVKRSDVVVYRPAPAPLQEYIGRVVALPSESVEIGKGYVKVNGKALNEPYADWGKWPEELKTTITLKNGEYLTLTDKRLPFITEDNQMEYRILTLGKYSGKFF